MTYVAHYYTLLSLLFSYKAAVKDKHLLGNLGK